jgi:phospholipid transport system substrate-binding protein
MRRIIVSGLAFLVATAAILALPVRQAAATPEQASKFVGELSAQVLDVLTSNAPIDARESRLRGVLQRGLDLDFMSRFAIGRYWQDASPQQRSRYAAVFADFVLRSYAHRLADQRALRFTITSARETENGDVVVDESVEVPQGPPANYSFRVRNSGKGPKIIDVAVEGASLLLAQRMDFMLVVQKQGLDGLIQAIRQKTLQQTGT